MPDSKVLENCWSFVVVRSDSSCPRTESQNVHYSIYLTFHKSYFLSLQQSIYIIPTSTYLTKSEQAINIFPTFSHDLTLWLNKNCSYKIPINQYTWNVCMISCLLGLAVVALLICLLMKSPTFLTISILRSEEIR